MGKQGEQHRVLVTGGAGAIGRVVCRQLCAGGHAVRSFDRRAAADAGQSLTGELTDAAALDAACAGMDTVVHLAATTDDADFLTRLLPDNIVGLFQVLEAAVRQRVRRVVLASSIQVVAGIAPPAGHPVRVADGTCATNHYAATKVLAEEFSRLYARKYRLSTLAVRLGWFPRNATERARMAEYAGFHDIYLSHADAARFFACAVTATTPAPGESAVLFATSKPAHGPGVDLAPSRIIIGYEPQDMWPSESARAAGQA